MIDAKYYVVYGSRYVVVSVFRMPAIRVLSGSTIMLIYGFKVRIYGCLCGNFILRKKCLISVLFARNILAEIVSYASVSRIMLLWEL